MTKQRIEPGIAGRPDTSTNIKNKITNTEVNVIMKDLIMYLSNIFTRTKLV